MNSKKLHKKIMRRIYAAYVMRLVGGTRSRHAGIMLLSGASLARFVSVVDVAQNFSHVTVGQVGGFVLSALLHTELWTLIILGLLVYAVVSFIKGDRLAVSQPASFA